MRSLKKLFMMPIAMALCLSTTVSASHNEPEFEHPCESGVICRVTTREPFVSLYNTLIASTNIAQLEALLDIVLFSPNSATATTAYSQLFTLASNIASSVAGGGRVIISLPDGRFVLDTDAGALDAACANLSGNGYCHFLAGTVVSSTPFGISFLGNISALNATLWRCGVGAAIQPSSIGTPTTNTASVSVRLGPYLDGSGVVTISSNLFL